MRLRRTLLTIMSVIVGLLAATATATPAQADRELKTHHTVSSADAAASGGVVGRAPAAPANAAELAGALASSPTTYPWAPATFVPTNSDFQYAPGNLCALVWDPTRNLYKQFSFYRCNRYWLYNWIGDGFVRNAQWGATATFYDPYGAVLGRIPADGITFQREWYPVWSIRNC